MINKYDGDDRIDDASCREKLVKPQSHGTDTNDDDVPDQGVDRNLACFVFTR